MTKKITQADEKRAALLSEWAESDAGLIPHGARVVRSTGDGAGRALIENALGGADTLTRALGGRPALDGQTGGGASPKRQVRLPRDLDALLTERAEVEHRKPSDIMRDALSAYLKKAS